MAATGVQYQPGGTNPLITERIRLGRSPAVWKNFPIARVREEPGLGDFVWDNFLSWVGTSVASNRGNYWGKDTGWTSFEATTTGTIKATTADFPVPGTGAAALLTAGAALGVIRINNVTTAHNSSQMEMSGGANGAQTAGIFAVPSSASVTAPLAGQFPKLFFEARVRFNQTSGGSHFIGMAVSGKTSAINTFINGSDVIQIQNAIGFAVNSVATTGFATSATKIQPFYSAASAAIQAANQTNFTGSVGGIPSTTDYPGHSITPSLSPADALTDFTKLGFYVDATSPDGVCLAFYQDGNLLAKQTLSQIVAANWPSGVNLTPLIYTQMTGAGTTAISLDLDWIAVGQQLTAE